MFVGEWYNDKGVLLHSNVRSAIRARNENVIRVLKVKFHARASQGSAHYKAKCEFTLTTAPGGWGTTDNTMTVHLYDGTALVHRVGSY